MVAFYFKEEKAKISKWDYDASPFELDDVNDKPFRQFHNLIPLHS